MSKLKINSLSFFIITILTTIISLNFFNTRLVNAFVMSSKPTTDVPWQNDQTFISAKEKNKCDKLVAAYMTVLKDPLPGEEANVHHAADMLCGTVVMPGETFSQNKKLGPYTTERGFKKGPTYINNKVSTTVGGGVCKIASTLYNVAILSNLEIVERHAHSLPVPYVPYGQDATVSYGEKDIRFKNTTDSPILIWAKGIENTLYIGFYGNYTPPKIEWVHEATKDIPFKTKYQTNNTIPKGTEKTIIDGMNGRIMRSWICINNQDGTTTKRPARNSSYAPLDSLIWVNK